MPAESAQHLMEKIQSLPADRVREVEDFVDFLKGRVNRRERERAGERGLDFPVDDLGAWPEGVCLSREELYGDDGR